MSDVMPIEQAEFIDNLQRWFNESTNMCHEDCYRFAFIVWQHKDYLSKVLGTDERKNVLDEVDKYLRELSDIKSGCGEWIEKHDEKIRADERAKIVDKFNKELMHWEDWILAESPSGFRDAKEFSADDMARMITRTIRECSDVVNKIIAEINSNK